MALSLFHLHGDLKDLRFPRLLAALREDAFTGVFQATTRGSDEPPGPDVDAASQAAETTREVHFSGGHIAWAISTEREESLKAYLIRNGALTAAQWSQAEERARDVTLRQALIDLGLVAARELTQIERGRAEEIVLTLFTARNGEYRVRERQLAPGTPDLKIDPRPLILKGVVEAGDRALILDEIGSLDSVYVVKRSPQEDAAFTLPGEFQSILRHIDGKRSIAQICALTSLPDYFACALFAALSMAGAVKRSYTKGQPRGRAEIVRGADVADSAVRARPPLPASEPPQTPLVLEAAPAPELEPEPAPEPEPPVEPAETVKAQPTARPPIITTARPAPP
ncbi:MAG TPA: DUF4388 domain-containing protein, partial [Candidatus Polarisedimenticolia bacterium]|nr:DUF4388 domain-containing protein [Candidatus Polarisedimenticolia bacterium]